MTTPSRGSSGADAPRQELDTPPPRAMSDEEKKEIALFAEHDLSPPPKSKNGNKTFKQSKKKIEREMKKEWKKGGVDEKRIILFLVSRNFRGSSNKNSRVTAIKELLEIGRIRDRMLQVLKVEGDGDISAQRHNHYIASCLAIIRYFQQEGAKGFVPDMSVVTYYLREQKYGSCFLQAACVLISYLVQAHGKQMPPPDGSKLIRHNFTDDQLHKYVVDDEGGDSIAVFRLLEKQFFDCDHKQRNYSSIPCPVLRKQVGLDSARAFLNEGPGLLAKFKVPLNFKVDRKGNMKPGYARFTEWGREAEFIELEKPSDEVELQFQKELARKWMKSCNEPHPVCSFDTFGDSTAATVPASASLDEVGESYLSHAENDSEIVDSDEYLDDVEVGEPFADSNDMMDDDSKDVSEIAEGDDVYHAMILLGTRVVNGETFWTLQNSWSGMRIIEMSTDYLAESGGVLVFFEKAGRYVRDKPSPLIQFCPSPIAESGPLDRADCENWDELLIMDDDACLEDGRDTNPSSPPTCVSHG